MFSERGVCARALPPRKGLLRLLRRTGTQLDQKTASGRHSRWRLVKLVHDDSMRYLCSCLAWQNIVRLLHPGRTDPVRPDKTALKGLKPLENPSPA